VFVFLMLIVSALLMIIYGGRLGPGAAALFGLNSFGAGLWEILAWPLLLAFVLLGFNILYVYAPNISHRRWYWLTPGTIVGVGLWLAGSFGFRAYLSYFNRFTLTYGSIGAVIILLLWFYLSGIAILVGEEVNSIIERSMKSRSKGGSQPGMPDSH